MVLDLNKSYEETPKTPRYLDGYEEGWNAAMKLIKDNSIVTLPGKKAVLKEEILNTRFNHTVDIKSHNSCCKKILVFSEK